MDRKKDNIRWAELFQSAGLTLLTWLVKLGAFCLWCTTSVLEILLRAGNKALRSYLFPNRK